MNHHFSATVPSAQGLCQSQSVSQTVRLFHSSAAMAREERHRSSVVNDKIPNPSDEHRNRNTSENISQAPLQSASDGSWKVR